MLIRPWVRIAIVATVAALALWALAAGVMHAADAVAPRLTVPLVVWDINFNSDRPGRPPAGPTKADLEARLGHPPAEWLPLRTYYDISYVTRTRQALVVPEAFGLKDQPLRFTYSENAGPTYGPRLRVAVPAEIAQQGACWRLSLDIAKGDIAVSGGLQLWDIGEIVFHEDGTLRLNDTPLIRYAANKPIHLECLINVPEKTVTATADGNTAAAVTAPWHAPKSRYFSTIILHGLLPGGHSQAPSTVAFDNIKLVLEAVIPTP
ncbi:MAG: hypothetical protein ACYC7E_05640 [Armatimonadota bacterium]